MAPCDHTSLPALLERIGRLMQGAMHSEGLPPAQWHALHYLGRANRFSRTPTALRLYLDATKGTVSQTLMALARKGLVRKERSRADRRSVSLQLTARGAAILARGPQAGLSTAVAMLAPRTRDDLSRGLADLLRLLLAQRHGQAFGICSTCRHFRRATATGGLPAAHHCGLLDVPLRDEDATRICVEHAA